MKAIIRVKASRSRNYQTYGLEQEQEVEYENEAHLKALRLRLYLDILAQVLEYMEMDNNNPKK